MKYLISMKVDEYDIKTEIPFGKEAYATPSVKEVRYELGAENMVTRVLFEGTLSEFNEAIGKELEGYEKSTNALIKVTTANKKAAASDYDSAVLSVENALSPDCNIGFMLFFDDSMVDGDEIEIILPVPEAETDEFVTKYEYTTSGIKLSRKDELLFLFLELTSGCNLACEHCASDSGRCAKNELTTDQWKNVIKYVAERFNKELITLYVTGGEPMLRSDFYEIVNYINSQGLKWGLTTNGTLIGEDDVEELKAAEMKTVSISVDGLEEDHDSFRRSKGSFKKAINAVKLLNDSGAFEVVQITTVVTSENISHLPEMYEYFKEIGLKSWRLASVDPSGRGEKCGKLLSAENYLTLFRFIDCVRGEDEMSVNYGCSHYVPDLYGHNLRDYEYFCAAGRIVASVTSTGDIFSCLNIERRPELIQGNILTDDLVTVWENGFADFRGNVRAAKSEKCRHCKSVFFCAGDSAHTWDYEKNEPKICLFEMFDKNFTHLKTCKKCGAILFEDSLYCHECGSEYIGDFRNYYPPEIQIQMLYGPPTRKYFFKFTCRNCGKTWGKIERIKPLKYFCPKCGSDGDSITVDIE